jgi:sigma-B regulation protein RsbU (phosphoserine phosphatase)
MDQLLDFAPCGYISFKDDGKIVHVNHTLSNWLGYSADDLKGKSIEHIFTLATRIFYNTHFFPLVKLHTKAEEIFISLVTKDKKDIPVLVNAERRSEEGVAIIHCVFIQVNQRKQYEEEILKAKRDAEAAVKENKHLEELKSALESHTIELERQYQKQLSITQNLVQFSKIISHDLQEPLRKILFFSDTIFNEEKDKLTSKSKSALEKVNAATRKLKVLITGLQQYVSVDAEKSHSKVELNLLVQRAKDRAVDYRKFDDFDFECDELPEVIGYKTQLEVMFFQLIDNSIQFREPSRKLSIKISSVALDENLYRVTKDRYKFSEHIRLKYSDNGIGFDNQYKEYVFELLKKINPATEGLGLGLALIKKIIDNHSGVLDIQSEVDKGTTTTITLPVKID